MKQAPESEQTSSNINLKQAEHEMKMQMAREKASLDMESKRAKFQQEQAERDARNVLKLREIQ